MFVDDLIVFSAIGVKANTNSTINAQYLLYDYQNNLMFVYSITIQCVLQVKDFKDYVFFSLIYIFCYFVFALTSSL